MKKDYSSPQAAAERALILMEAVSKADARWAESAIKYAKEHYSDEVLPIFFDAKDGLGNTPLHHAAMLHPEIENGISQLLLAAGAPRDARNKNGETPADIAAINNPDLFLTAYYAHQGMPAAPAAGPHR